MAVVTTAPATMSVNHPTASPTGASLNSTNTGNTRPTLKASQKSLAIASAQADDPIGLSGLIEVEAEFPEEKPYRPVHVFSGGPKPGTSKPLEK